MNAIEFSRISGPVLLLVRPTAEPPQVGEVVTVSQHVCVTYEHPADAFSLEAGARRMTNAERLRAGQEQPCETLYAVRVTQVGNRWSDEKGGTIDWRIDEVVRSEAVGPVAR